MIAQCADKPDPTIDQQLDFVLELEQLCRQVDAQFIELVLLISAQDAAARLARRSRHPEISVQRDAHALFDRSGGLGALPAMYERLRAVVAARTRTIAVTTIDGRMEQADRDILAQIDND